MAEKNVKRRYNKWLVIGLLSVAIGVPNGTVIKILADEIGSIAFTFLKFALMSLVFLPIVISFAVRHKKILKRNIFNLTMVTIGTAVSVLDFYRAIELSTASYTSIVSLLSPIVLVVMSNRLIKEKVGARAVAGITLAAIGGLLVVALPAVIHGAIGSVFYPAATFLVIINCFCHPMSIVYQRKSNEDGIPFAVYAGISAIGTTLLALVVSMFQAEGPSGIVAQAANVSAWGWAGIIYSGFLVTFVARILWIKSYQHMGSAAGGGLSYLEMLLGVVLPMVVLGESLSIELLIGAILILLGVYIAESRPAAKNGMKKHHYGNRLHYLHRHSRLH